MLASESNRIPLAGHQDCAEELLRKYELHTVLEKLSNAGVYPLILKGTALAYDVYDVPARRTRMDTDLLIAECHNRICQEALTELGYIRPLASGQTELFRQFVMRKEDAFGVSHVLDIHWRITNRRRFDRLFAYPELFERRRALPRLSQLAFGLSLEDALILSCVHPVMHHHGVEDIQWIYDTHLLASLLSPLNFDVLIDRAKAMHVSGICRRALLASQERFQTPIAPAAIKRLAEDKRESALDRPQNRYEEVLSDLSAIPGWRSRLSYLQEILFPPGDYMREKFGKVPVPLAYAVRIGAAILNTIWSHLIAKVLKP